MSEKGFIQIRCEEDFRKALERDRALLFKHSSACPISGMAHQEVIDFMEENPEVPVYLVEVLGQKNLCRRIAEKLDVRHASPQAILLKAGEPAWHASHSSITAGVLARQL